MTGTAKTEASEFSNIYKLEAIVVPTNVPTKRTDNPDVVFGKESGAPAPVPRQCTGQGTLPLKQAPIAISLRHEMEEEEW